MPIHIVSKETIWRRTLATVRISPLEAHVGYWLRYVSNHISRAFALKIATRGITVAEWVVMRELYAASSEAPSALANKLGMTRGAISKIVNRLEAKGFVKRSIGATDRRYQALKLTRKLLSFSFRGNQ